MDSELLGGYLSEDVDLQGSKREIYLTTPTPYTDVFIKRFPYYLSIGMTEEQYWDKDCLLTKYYREAEEIRTEKANQMAWLQGMYIYDALARISPILRAFTKKGTKAQPYPEEPYPIGRKSVEDSKNKKEKENYDKAKRYMEAYMVQHNKRLEKESE